jgi:dTDP-4-dehydrorhamnose reductase
LEFSRADVDVADAAALEVALRRCEEAGVCAVVNASGMTNLEACEDDPGMAQRVNGDAVGQMAEHCATSGMRFFHFSTDYVFNGEKQDPYIEEDAPCPISVYGESKLAGERAALEADGGNFVFRVAWVFGPARPAFPDMIIQRALAGSEVAVVADKWGSPTSAQDVASWLLPLVRSAADSSLPGGLFHLCNSGICSWMDYAEHALETAREIGLPVSTTRPQPLELASMKMFRAPRPVHSGMCNAKFQRTFGMTLRPWREALADHIRSQHTQAN